jgi:hypothetical protein
VSDESRERLTADVLEDLLERLIRIEGTVVRTENKVDVLLKTTGRLETATVELSRDVKVLRERLVDEASTRAGLGQLVVEHDVELALLKGGRDG